jgi:hypothetical protein
VFQIGVMTSRPAAPLRVCVGNVERVTAFLGAAGWPGAIADVERLLARFGGFADHVALDFDVDAHEGLLPKLGLELYLQSADQLAARLPALLDALCQDRLCLPQKAAGVLAWSGVTHHRRHPGAWPAELLRRAALRPDGASSTFLRWLHHFKLVLEPGRAPAAKVYLAVAPAFLTDAAIRDGMATRAA